MVCQNNIGTVFPYPVGDKLNVQVAEKTNIIVVRVKLSRFFKIFFKDVLFVCIAPQDPPLIEMLFTQVYYALTKAPRKLLT